MLLVIGLDGADWRILDPWIDSGDLPTLAALRARGAWGSLRSTIRPESSIAWSTFATGVNPGRHGIFSFSAQHPADYKTTLNTAATMRAAPFWLHAAAKGARIALLNVPMTYPPQPFAQGALVAGMLTPGPRSDFTYPQDLRPALLEAVPDYVINVDRTGLSLERFIQESTRAIRARARAGLWILQQKSWDAALIVFTASDRLQHYTLHLLDSDHPRFDPDEAQRLLPLLLDAYRAIDTAIGDLVDATGPDATILLLSDHGFSPCARMFQPNAWLEQRGVLHRSGHSRPSPDPWHRMRERPALRRLKKALPLIRDWRRPPALGGHLGTVDWSQTRAVYSPAGGIRFNVRGREPGGIVDPAELTSLADDLTAELQALVDPETGIHPIKAVYRREALYEGPYVDLAPDLIVEPRRDDPDPAHNTILRYGFEQATFAGSGDLTGNHALDGIFLACGSGIPSRRIEHARLLDIAPTILHTLGLAIPAHLEGEVLPLREEGPPVVREEGGDEIESTGGASPAFDPEEQATVEDRLRSLGYL